MDEPTLRIEALRLAQSYGEPTATTISRAQDYYRFLIDPLQGAPAALHLASPAIPTERPAA